MTMTLRYVRHVGLPGRPRPLRLLPGHHTATHRLAQSPVRPQRTRRSKAPPRPSPSGHRPTDRRCSRLVSASLRVCGEGEQQAPGKSEHGSVCNGVVFKGDGAHSLVSRPTERLENTGELAGAPGTAGGKSPAEMAAGTFRRLPPRTGARPFEVGDDAQDAQPGRCGGGPLGVSPRTGMPSEEFQVSGLGCHRKCSPNCLLVSLLSIFAPPV